MFATAVGLFWLPWLESVKMTLKVGPEAIPVRGKPRNQPKL